MNEPARPRTAPKRRNLAVEITQRLRQAIVTGALKPGEPLAEPVLAEQFKASRAPVREALIALEREGLVEFNEQSRTRVRQLTAEDFEEISSMRSALESLAARHACERWTETLTRAVEENLRQQELAATLGELSHLDVELHEMIVRLSGHRRLISTWLGLRGQFEMWLAHTHRLQETLAFEPRQLTVNHHRRLLSALASGKPQLAADAMTLHIEAWREWLPLAFPPQKPATLPSVRSPVERNGFARKTATITLAVWALVCSMPARAETTPEQLAFFESKIRPLLADHCYECHSAAAKKLKGGLRLDSRAAVLKGGDSGSVVVPGNPDKSLLLRAVRHEVNDLAMPPKKPKLADTAIADLATWVKAGAPFPESTAKRAVEQPHWAFQPVRNPLQPKVKRNSWPRTTVDYFIAAALDRQGLRPAPPADKRTLLRRATYDLTGLPPTPEEVDAFEQDTSPKAFARVVDRLLAAPHYGERWGRLWLDVVRYADTAGENTDHPLPHAWRYRNWVIQAFNQDKPYDEFIREQLAGDLLAASGPPEKYADRIIATGYLAIARRFGHDIDKDMHLTMEDTIDTLGKSILGLTLGCARCHNHKFDPVTARDYYGLYGIFESTRFAFPGCEPKQQPRDLVPLWAASELATRRKPYEEKLAEVGAVIKQLNDAQTVVTDSWQPLLAKSVRLLAKGEFDDGGAQPISPGPEPITVAVKAGELIRLTVLPKANHGADTTIIDWEVTEVAGQQRRWNLAADVTADFLAGNPHPDGQGNAATWCFIDARKGLHLLPESVEKLEGKSGLNVWRSGDNPAAFVNATDQPIKVWTTLPARTFFMHPGPDGPVAVGWLSPITGTVRLTGRVADAHAGGGDGVAWTVEHLAADLGGGMKEMAAIAQRLRGPMQQRADLKTREPKVPLAYAVAEGTIKDAKLQKRGDPEQLGAEIPRKFLDVLGGQTLASTNQSGRLELGQWLTNPANPLTARVMVNRIWQGHFGKGLVATPNDFGRQGQPPTHPDLLDSLVTEFIKSGWSMKSLHRHVMLSATYQQASVVSEPAASRPAAGKAGLAAWNNSAMSADYSTFPRRRLTAEELRDTLLFLSGELDRAPGGAHPFPPEDKWSFSQHGPFADNYETLNRSVYVMQKRNRRTPFFAMFDGADPNASTAKRDVTTVPTQALFFMNDPFVHARAEKFAARILKSAPGARARLDFACRQLFGRNANPVEQTEAAEFLNAYAATCPDQIVEQQSALGWAAYARVLFGSNELLHLD